MELTIYGKMGTFQGLVNQYMGRGVSPDMVIKRLASRGCVRLVRHNWVQLLDPNWRWIEEDELGLLDNAKNVVQSISATLLHNFANRQNDAEKWTERRVLSFHIPPSRLLAAKQAINHKILDQLEELAKLIRSYEESGTGSNFSVGAGYYYWECDEAN